jgi:hypothetical protein
MKPWFVKEADIIKFPEPEKKVIELPNVQSYPDFLTGVKDLHNRKAKGEISQDSHDKLYTDLIHRFMKKESFETPWFLREATQKLINGSSRGVYNEIILAIAIFYKFKKGGQEINEGEVKSGLKKLSQTQQGFQANTSTGDNVKLIIGDKGPKLTADLQDTNNIQLMNEEITGNTGFANVDLDTEKFSKIFAKNKKPDNIIVKQMGGERSKIDVLLSYDKDGDTVNIKGYSAKTFSPRLDNTDVNTLEAVSKYFAPFGVNIDVTKYQEIDKKVSSTELFKNVFQKVVDFGNALLEKDNESGERIFVNAMMKFVKTAMTGGEDAFLLVDISKGDFSTHDFAVLMNNLDKVNLSIRLRTFAKSGQPMIEIFDSKSNLNLLILRYTYSEPRVSKSSGKLPGRNRIFVDAGPLFKQLSKVVYNKEQNI